MVRRKRCAGPCGETKPWDEFWAHTKWPDGSMRTPKARCKVCMNERTQRERRAGRWRNRETHAAYMRDYSAKVRADPERLAAHRAYQREERRARLGIPPERWRHERDAAVRQPSVRLPIGPLRDIVAASGLGDSDLAEMTGSAPRRLYAIRNELADVDAREADRILIALGEQLGEVYPLEAV